MVENIMKILSILSPFFFQTVEMSVHMDCPGCESKIKKALQKLDGKKFFLFLAQSHSDKF